MQTNLIASPGQDLKNVSLSTLTEIMNAVAPPISEHEVIQVWLSHDMQGYEGIESLVYRSLAKVCSIDAFCRPYDWIIAIDYGASRRWRSCRKSG
jgi:hypothetical protein